MKLLTEQAALICWTKRRRRVFPRWEETDAKYQSWVENSGFQGTHKTDNINGKDQAKIHWGKPMDVSKTYEINEDTLIDNWMYVL